GDVNRPDGLMDVFIAVNGSDGPKLLVYEGPRGALLAEPETFSLPSSATALALGNLDSDGLADLLVAAGRNLLLIHGRDRKLSQRSEERATVPQAVIEHRAFNTAIRSVALGKFTSSDRLDIAVVDETGTVFFLHSPERGNARRRLSLEKWQLDSTKEQNWSG